MREHAVACFLDPSQLRRGPMRGCQVTPILFYFLALFFYSSFSCFRGVRYSSGTITGDWGCYSACPRAAGRRRQGVSGLRLWRRLARTAGTTHWHPRPFKLPLRRTCLPSLPWQTGRLAPSFPGLPLPLPLLLCGIISPLLHSVWPLMPPHLSLVLVVRP